MKNKTFMQILKRKVVTLQCKNKTNMMTLLQANEVVEKTSGMMSAISEGEIDLLKTKMYKQRVEHLLH